MADTTTVTCTELKGSGAGEAYEKGGVYVRTFSFPTLASATGYGDTDILNLITVPANTQVIAASAKSSVTQGSATFALNFGGGTAFVSAVAVTQTTTFQPMAVVIANATTGATDETLQIVIGADTCAAATVTISLVCAALGTNEGTYDTYSL